MAEFTGERVIPELVDADLLNEHLARYRFAKRFAAKLGESARILDAGCGTGYGTAELAGAASVTGVDIAAEAVGHARSRYGSGRVNFVQSACETLPFSDGAFDLLVAFEVIRTPGSLKGQRREDLRVSGREASCSTASAGNIDAGGSYASSAAAHPVPWDMRVRDTEAAA